MKDMYRTESMDRILWTSLQNLPKIGKHLLHKESEFNEPTIFSDQVLLSKLSDVYNDLIKESIRPLGVTGYMVEINQIFDFLNCGVLFESNVDGFSYIPASIITHIKGFTKFCEILVTNDLISMVILKGNRRYYKLTESTKNRMVTLDLNKAQKKQRVTILNYYGNAKAVLDAYQNYIKREY